MDTVSKKKRSWIMSRVRGKNTAPEIAVRSTAHKLGFRFRLHRSDLPGKPDLAFPSRAKAIFVHGCFWHGHRCARGNREPKANGAYWRTKIEKNRERDKRHRRSLRALGWEVLVIWECQIGDEQKVKKTLKRFLGNRGAVSYRAHR